MTFLHPGIGNWDMCNFYGPQCDRSTHRSKFHFMLTFVLMVCNNAWTVFSVTTVQGLEKQMQRHRIVFQLLSACWRLVSLIVVERRWTCEKHN